MTTSIDLPYFDVLLEGLRQGHPDLSVGFGRHVHWGYWDDAHRPDGSMVDFAAAAERLCQRVCDAGGVRDGQAILDVGCGLGGTVASLNERLSGVSLAGLNIDARQIDRARREVHARPGNEIAFHEGDACQMPFPDASFDVVLAVECAFHFPSRARFFAEARRVLRPGGVLSLCDFLPSKVAVPILRAQNLIFGGYVRNVVGPTDVSIPLDRYLALAREAGLTPAIEEDITRNTLPTYPILQKIALEMGVHGLTAKWGVGAMSLVSRLALLRYLILSFKAPMK